MKLGLVLAGGGARGAYQIGVWKALKELGVDKYIKVISGTSVGALNAILILQGDIQYAEDLWSKITSEQILPIKDHELSFKKVLLSLGIKNIDFIKKYMPKVVAGGTLSREGICKLMDDIDFQFLKDRDVVCYATCTEVPSLKRRYFKINDYKEDDIKTILSATSAIPMIYNSVNIDGEEYLDGGIVDNEPIQPVFGEGCDIIIVVHLSKDMEIDKSKYPNTNIIEIRPSMIECGEFEGTLEFCPDIAKKKIEMGYNDTTQCFKPIMELTRIIDKDMVVVKESLKDKIGKMIRRKR